MTIRIKQKPYCHTCGKHYHYLGINSHRAMHRRKNEDCRITYTYGDTYLFEFSRDEADNASQEGMKCP